MGKGIYIGIDVGSVSTNIVLLAENQKLLAKEYIRTKGRPIEAIKKGLNSVNGYLKK